MKYKHSDQEFQEAVKSSFSIRQVLTKLDIVPAGGNYATVNQRIKNLNLDTSHFSGQLWSKGKTIGPKRPIEDYLNNIARMTSHDLRRRLIKEGIFAHQCHDCTLTKWKERPIPLELHHKDGNRENNALVNLSLLCPNCHAFTENYRGKNK